MGTRERTPAMREMRPRSNLDAEVLGMLVRFLVAVTVARLAVFTLPVGLFFAAAANPPSARLLLATASALTIGSGLGLWPAGRVLDRIGRWRGLRLAMLAGAISLAALATAMWRVWPQPTVLGVAVVSGMAWSAMIATPRALLPELVPLPRLPSASGIEAATVEVALVLAPLVGVLLGQWGPTVVPVIAAGLLVVSAVLLPTPTDRGRSGTSDQQHVSRRVRAVAGLALLLGLSGGLVEPGLAGLPPALFGGPIGNALLFVAVGVGSAAGGLITARTAWPCRLVHSVPLFALHAVALAGVVATGGMAQITLLVVAGLPIAPLQSLAALHLDGLTNRTRAGETFGLVATVLTLGTGAGQAIAAHTTGRLDPPHLVLLAAAPPMLAATLIALHHARAVPPADARSM